MRSILVVDDHNGMRYCVSEMIESMGIECVAVESAEKAIAMLMERDFDIVISDYHLEGGMNGDKFLASVRINKPHVSTILMSGLLQTDSNYPMFKEHYALPKPFSPKELQKAILSVLKPMEWAS